MGIRDEKPLAPLSSKEPLSAATDAKKDALAEALSALSAQNLRISEDNRQLREQAEILERLAKSRGFHYLSEADQRFLRGGLGDKVAFLRDAFSELGHLKTELSIQAQREASVSQGALQALRTELSKPSERLRIAFSNFGGMGDSLWATSVLEALRRQYVDAEIFMFTGIEHVGVFAGNPYIERIVGIARPDMRHFNTCMVELVDKGRLDAWYECRYQVAVHFSPMTRVPQWIQQETEARFREFGVNFETFPQANNLLSRAAALRGLNLVGYVTESCGLVADDPQIFIYPEPDDFAVQEQVNKLGEFITIHHGCDRAMLKEGYQTKNWSTERWESVIAELKRETGLAVIQLGTNNEYRLVGADHSLMGLPRVQQAAVVLSRALLHLDTEGGLVHLARAVHTPSLVLFGPTPSEYFGYPQNIKVEAGDCHDCWWSTQDWFQRCPRGLPTPSCMDDISVAQVLQETHRALKTIAAARKAVYALGDFSPQATTLSREDSATWKEVQAALSGIAFSSMKSWDHVYAVKQIASRLGDLRGKILVVGRSDEQLALAPYLASKGHTAFANSLGGADREFWKAHQDTIQFRYGSDGVLPYDNAQFDVIVCLSVGGQPRFENLLREMTRVMKPGGALIITLELSGIATTGTSEAQLHHHLASLGIAHDSIKALPTGVYGAGLTITKRIEPAANL